MKLTHREKHNWGFEHNGKEYIISKEPLVRNGGNGKWYVVWVDPKYGRCIDLSVPEGHFDTMKQAKDALIEHINEPSHS